jgi:hypothetical protein
MADLRDRTLSSHALAALAEFNAEKEAHQQKFQNLKDKSEENAASVGPLSMDAFAEDWNESQFWVRDHGNDMRLECSN